MIKPTPALACAAALAITLFAAACSDRTAPPAAGETHTGIYTTFYPTTYFAGRISAGLLPVICPLPEGADPIFWQPSRTELAAYQAADLVVINGSGFEKWLTTASLSPGRIVDTGAALAGDLLRYENATVHRHGPAGEHSHEGVDGHTWLDPLHAKTQAAAILAALTARWPAHSAAFTGNAAALHADLDALDARLRALTPPPLLASHPAYNYLAKRYDWDIDNLDLDPAAMPSAAQFADIRARITTRPAALLLWESAPLPEIAERLRAEFGLRSIAFSPCESLPVAERNADHDYLDVMNANIDRLSDAL